MNYNYFYMEVKIIPFYMNDINGPEHRLEEPPTPSVLPVMFLLPVTSGSESSATATTTFESTTPAVT